MSVKWKISHAERLVTALCEGTIVLGDIERYLDDVVVSDALPYAKIFDAGEAIWGLTDDDMLALGGRIRAYRALAPSGPIAIIAVSDRLYEHAQLFATLAEAERPLKIFRTAEAARKWLASLPSSSA